MENFEPVIVAFCCHYCAYTAADMAGSQRLAYPANVKINQSALLRQSGCTAYNQGILKKVQTVFTWLAALTVTAILRTAMKKQQKKLLI